MGEVFDAETDHMGSILGTCMMKGEIQFLQAIVRQPHMK